MPTYLLRGVFEKAVDGAKSENLAFFAQVPFKFRSKALN
jgi:hypothetical protein